MRRRRGRVSPQRCQACLLDRCHLECRQMPLAASSTKSMVSRCRWLDKDLEARCSTWHRFYVQKFLTSGIWYARCPTWHQVKCQSNPCVLGLLGRLCYAPVTGCRWPPHAAIQGQVTPHVGTEEGNLRRGFLTQKASENTTMAILWNVYTRLLLTPCRNAPKPILSVEVGQSIHFCLVLSAWQLVYRR